MLTRRILALAVAGLALAWLAGSTGQAAEPDAKLLPGDAEFVLVANYKQLVDSPMFKKYGLQPFQQKLQEDEAKKVLQSLNLDPLKDIDSLTVTNAGKFDENGRLFMVVKGRFDLTKINAAIQKEGLESSKVGGITVYKTKGDGTPAYFGFKDDKTLVLSTKKDYLGAVLGGTIKAGPNHAKLQAALKKANPRDSITSAVVLTEEMKAQLKQTPQIAQQVDKLDSVTVNINVTGDAQLDILINAADAATAGQVNMQLKQFLPLIKITLQNQPNVPPIVGEVLDKIKTTTDGNSVVISLKVTDEMIQKALKGQ